MEHTEFQKMVVLAGMMGWCQAGRNLAYIYQNREIECLKRREDYVPFKTESLVRINTAIDDKIKEDKKKKENLKSWAESHGYRTYLK